MHPAYNSAIFPCASLCPYLLNVPCEIFFFSYPIQSILLPISFYLCFLILISHHLPIFSPYPFTCPAPHSFMPYQHQDTFQSLFSFLLDVPHSYTLQLILLPITSHATSSIISCYHIACLHYIT